MKWLIVLYPRAWRRRYGVEFEALLAQQRPTPALVWDVLRGALDARFHMQHWHRGLTGKGAPALRKGKQGDRCCSFCGKAPQDVRRLIAGPGVYICDACIQLCNELIADHTLPPVDPATHKARTRASRPRKRRWFLSWRQHIATTPI